MSWRALVRYTPKAFRQRRPDGRGGWINNLKGVRRVLYRLPELIEAVKAGRAIFIPEGEKDVLRLVKLGLDATTNAMGAKKFPADQAHYLTGADVVILEDNDEEGRAHTEDLRRKLSLVVNSLKRLAWPELPNGVSANRLYGFERFILQSDRLPADVSGSPRSPGRGASGES